MENKRFVLPTWELVGGESKRMTLTLRYDNGALYDLPDSTVVFTVTSFVNSDASPVVDKTGEGNAEIVQCATGEYCDCQLTLDPDDTYDLSGKYIYQAKITDRNGNVSCPQGIMIIKDNND